MLEFYGDSATTKEDEGLFTEEGRAGGEMFKNLSQQLLLLCLMGGVPEGSRDDPKVPGASYPPATSHAHSSPMHSKTASAVTWTKPGANVAACTGPLLELLPVVELFFQEGL